MTKWLVTLSILALTGCSASKFEKGQCIYVVTKSEHSEAATYLAYRDQHYWYEIDGNILASHTAWFSAISCEALGK